MKNLKKIYDAYQNYPVDGIKMILRDDYLLLGTDSETCPEETGNHFITHVYLSGGVCLPSYCDDTMKAMRILKEQDPDMHRLVLIIQNDLKILDLRDTCPGSFLFAEERTDSITLPQYVDTHISQWEKSTGCMVALTEEEKLMLYGDQIKGHLFTSADRITAWLDQHHISYIHTGEVKISIRSEDRKIRVETNIDKKGDHTNVTSSHAFDIPIHSNLPEWVNEIWAGIKKKLLSNVD